MAFRKWKWKWKTERASPVYSSRLSKASDSSDTTTKDIITSPDPPLQQNSRLLTLPLELIQHIATYLDHSSAASLSLSSRYTCYAIGRNDLTKHLSPSCTLPKFQRRKNIEILERAFSSHWYCAWCDKFHRHDIDGGPTKYAKETRRDCAEFNSFLHDGQYMVFYHHVRLALNRALWGDEYGISLKDFAYDGSTKRISGKTVWDTRLSCEARIVEGRLILHAVFVVVIPPRVRRLGADAQAKRIESILPHLVAGHRNSRASHTGFQSSLTNTLTDGRNNKVHLCYVCATDFRTGYDWANHASQADPDPVIKIEVWRDLGDGRNPFDASWRAHGELGKGREGFANDALRLAYFRDGDIKKAFVSDNHPRSATGPLA